MTITETLTELIQANPKVSIILIAVVVTFVSMLVTMLFTDREKMKEIKNKQSACRDLMKKHKGNTAKMMEIQQEMMACSMEQMRAGFKPMLITFIPFIVLFGIIRNVFDPVLGGWFWYYLITALVSSMIWRKVLKM